VKLAHLADLHLGFRQYHRQTASGINQREADAAAAFRQAVDQVIAARPDAVIIAGDIFHSVRPSNPAILFAYRQLHRLKEGLGPSVPLIVLAGNHDTPRSVETGSILSLYEEVGAEVVADQPRRLAFPALDLSILAVPHAALVSAERPVLEPAGRERFQVLTLHGEIEGLLPQDRHTLEYGGALLSLEELKRGGWSYTALGHYHVQREVAPRTWYAGALEYVSPNPWGELQDEREVGSRGKGWLLVDLATGAITRQPVTPARRVIDLDPIEAAGYTAAELDRELAAKVGKIRGGLADQIVRQVVWNVDRLVARELNHAAVRTWKAEALHYHLDLRRPERHRDVGVGAPGRRETLPEIVAGYLQRRPLPADLERERFVRAGVGLMEEVERKWQEG
jgi:DNA repair protein SbcD/Mre11